MRLAIAVGNDRVSPVFEAGERLMVLDWDHGRPVQRGEVRWSESTSRPRARALVDMGVDTLICGAITRETEMVLSAAGVRVLAWVCGNIHEVLRALALDRLEQPAFRMPGCPRAGLEAGLRSPPPAVARSCRSAKSRNRSADNRTERRP